MRCFKFNKLLARACCASLIAGSIHAEDSEVVTLTDAGGKSITVTILESNNQKVLVKRNSDEKQFLIPRERLTPESMDKVSFWEKSQLLVPYKNEFELNGTVYEVSFLLPKGPFVLVKVKNQPERGVSIEFDRTEGASSGNKQGNFWFQFEMAEQEYKKSIAKAKAHFDEIRAKKRENMTPKQLAEDNTKPADIPIVTKNFSGMYMYRDPGSPSYIKDSFDSKYIILTNGKFFARGRLNHWPHSPLDLEIFKKVIGTMQIKRIRSAKD